MLVTMNSDSPDAVHRERERGVCSNSRRNYVGEIEYQIQINLGERERERFVYFND